MESPIKPVEKIKFSQNTLCGVYTVPVKNKATDIFLMKHANKEGNIFLSYSVINILFISHLNLYITHVYKVFMTFLYIEQSATQL